MNEDPARRRLPETRTGPRRRWASGWRRQLLGFVVTLMVAFALVFGFVRPVVAQASRIPMGSMEPTIEVGDRVLANKLVYDFAEPERGDIVVFHGVEGTDRELIKRVVGLPGDTVAVRRGTLLVNGEPQEEPYLAAGPCGRYAPKTCRFGPVKVPAGHVFVTGDNRAHSIDSRFFGPVPEGRVDGEAFLRFWPPGRVGAP